MRLFASLLDDFKPPAPEADPAFLNIPGLATGMAMKELEWICSACLNVAQVL